MESPLSPETGEEVETFDTRPGDLEMLGVESDGELDLRENENAEKTSNQRLRDPE